MSLVWHIFKKDVRVIRGPWAAWVGLQVAALIAAHIAERHAWVDPYDNTQAAYRVACQGLAFLVWVFAYLLMPLAVHDDPVSGQSTAWVLKPVSPLQLLTAKVLGLAIFFVLTPIVVRLPWWLLHGYWLGSLARAAGETGLMAIFLAVPAMWLASVTADASRFYRWSLMGFGGLVVVYLVWVRLWFANSGGQDLNLSAPNLGLLLPLLLVSTVYQFRYRRTRRSLVVVGFGLAAMLLIPTSTDVSPSALPQIDVVATVDQGDALRLAAKDAPSPDAKTGWIVDTFVRNARRIAVTGTPPVQQVQSLAGASLARSLGVSGPSPEVVQVPSEAGEEATSPVRVRGRVMRVGESQTIPVREGASILHGVTRIRIDRVLTDLGGARHIVAVTETSALLPRLSQGVRDNASYFVVRSSRIEAVQVSQPVVVFPAAAVSVSKRILSIPTDNPREAMDQVQLLRVVAEPIGQFETILMRLQQTAP